LSQDKKFLMGVMVENSPESELLFQITNFNNQKPCILKAGINDIDSGQYAWLKSSTFPVRVDNGSINN
jgi:hypothetical protein